jgi:uncharacterized protein YkwD
MKSILKKIAVLSVVAVLLAVSMIPMVAFEVKRYYGDVDNDGEVSIEDARNILKTAIGISENNLSEHDFFAADIDGDGELKVADARRALRIAVQLEAKKFMPAYEFNKHEVEVVSLINDYRKIESDGELKNLILSEELSKVADQAALEFVTQTGSGLRRGDGTYYNTLLDENNIRYQFIDKVMCVSTTSYGQCFDKMVKDAQSSKAFESQNFNEIGVGAYSKDGRTVYWCIVLVG